MARSDAREAATAPAFQCYPADVLVDAAGMSHEEFGMYWRLALHAWREPAGLPDDAGKLAKLLGVTRAKLERAWPAVGAPFVSADGRLTLPWQDRERRKQAENRDKRQKAANTRWGKTAAADASAVHVHGAAQSNGHAPSDAHADALQCLSSSSASSSSTASTATTPPPPPPPPTAADAAERVTGAAGGSAAAAVRQHYPPEFEAAWRAYPERPNNVKRAAYRAWTARLAAGAAPDVLLAGVERYAAYCAARGWVGTEFVKQGATFFGPDEHWAGSWTPPPPAAERAAPAPHGQPRKSYAEIQRESLEAHQAHQAATEAAAHG